VLIAEGDSWFDYPGEDVLSVLEDRFYYRVESVAHRGDTIEGMAYDLGQVDETTRIFEHVKQNGDTPRAILLSGGGNDIAGDEFGVLLKHVSSGLDPLNAKVVDGVVNERLAYAIGAVIGKVTELSVGLFGEKIPVLLHGYADPVPDGRGYLGGFWKLPGPWLKPGLSAKGHTGLQKGCDILVGLMKTFNDLLAAIPTVKGFEHVTYVDMRDLLSNELPSQYKRSWDNELHPTDDAYALVAAEFDKAIQKVAPAKSPAAKAPKVGAAGKAKAPARGRATRQGGRR
jgi:lysophospholipase L1-like esterase